MADEGWGSMIIPPESIEVGQCYLTRSGYVRRVRAIHAGRVLYETRGRNRRTPPGQPRSDEARRAPTPGERGGHRAGSGDPSSFAGELREKRPRRGTCQGVAG